MPGHDLALLIDAARAAGDIGLKHFKSDPEVWDKSGGQGPVTEADLAIDRMLQSTLTTERAAYGWLSEETEDDASRLSNETVFIVDPIDGTRAFIEGSPNWSHSLAIARGGVVTEAVVYLPVSGALYAAERGRGATLNGDPLSVSASQEAQATILAAKPNMDTRFWPGGVPPVDRSFRSSIAYRLALVSEGAFDGMITLRPTWEWDVAAGSLLVEEAGGAVSQMDGTTPVFNNAHPAIKGTVAAGQNLHSSLVGRLTADRIS